MNRKLLTIACLVVAAGVALASKPRSRFDPKDVVRRVRKAQGATDFRPASGPACDWGEFLLDTNVVCVPAQGDQGMSSVAFDGTNYLVTWEDERNGSFDIYCARVTPDGVVIDTSGIAVSTAAGDQLYPVVAFNGTDFLVAWEDDRSGSGDIYAARVTKGGTVLDLSGIAVSTAASEQWFPAVASDGSGFLVVWQDGRSDEYFDIYGARVTGTGTVLDPTGFTVSRVAFDQMFPAIAFDGTNYFAVWEDDRNGLGDIYGTRITGAGAVLDSAGIAVSTAPDDQGGPGVMFNGSDFFVVWHDARSGGFYDVYAARVTDAGVVLDPSGIAVSAAPDDQWWPSVAFDGTNFNVSWQDFREGELGDIYCARVSTTGTVLDPSGIAVSRTADDQGYPRVAFAGSAFLILWEDDRDSSYSIYAARVNGEGSVLDPSGIPVSVITNDQWFPAVAFDGDNFLVVWQDGKGSSYDIYGVRVSPSGTVLDPQAIPICTAPCAQHDPDVEFGGTDYLVIWEDSRRGSTLDIYGTRVSKAGVVLDTAGIAICTAAHDQFEPSLAFDGTNFLVAWHDYRSGSGPDIYAARVTPTGGVLDPAGIGICTAAGPQRYTATAFDGTNFLVSWQNEVNTYDIYGARVNKAGVVLDPAGIAISLEAYDQRNAAVAFDGANFLVVWVDGRRGTWQDVFGARVNRDGVILDSTGIAICTSDYDQWYPKMTFDGTDFIVTWTDGRAGSATEIYGARVTPGGAVIDNFPIITGEGSQWSGDLTAAPGGQTLLAYGGWAGLVAGKSYNTYRIWGKFGPFPGLAEGRQSAPAGSQRMATVARGMLFLPKSTNPGSSTSWLLDAAGRKVADLKPGPNDVSLLRAGVYFVRESAGNSVEKVMFIR